MLQEEQMQSKEKVGMGGKTGEGGRQGPHLYVYTHMYAQTCHGYIYGRMSKVYLFMYDLQAQKWYLLLLLLPRTFSSFDA